MRKLLLTIGLVVMMFMSCTKQDNIVPTLNLKSATIESKYIVVLNDEISSKDAKFRNEQVKLKANGLLKKYGINGNIEDVYETALSGFTVKLNRGQAKQLESDLDVKRVEADGVVTINARKPKPTPNPNPTPTPTPTPTQNTPWGITRVGGGATYNGTNVAWVIDSGIDLTHPDLNVGSGVSFVSGVSSPNDDNGHGTHVAGTIAAKDNGLGVIGVAAGAKVIPVKVLDNTGSGTFSGVLNGINYVGINGVIGDVVNMSLGGGVSPTIDEAVKTVAAKGILFALAAGNETDNIYNHSPARASIGQPNIYAVTAMYSGDAWASFSNYGEGADYCAPGVSIYSTYKGGAYAAMSGTSMAAPHVAGLLLWGTLHGDGFVKNDPDGVADPIAHK